MSYNVDALIKASDLEVQHRVRRFDVQWGQPPYAIDYKRLSFTKMPAYYWSMEDSGTTVKHTVNHGYRGSDFNATFVGLSLPFEPGQADPTDNAVNFQTGGYATANSVSVVDEFQAGYTVSAYIKPTAMPGTQERCILSKMQTNGSAFGLCTLNIYQVGTSLHLKAWFPSAPAMTVTSAAIEFNEWSHVAMVVEPVGAYTGTYVGKKRARAWTYARVRFYLNGDLISEQFLTDSEPNNDGTQFTIGAYRISNVVFGASSFCGFIDEVAVYDGALNDDLIRKLALVGSGLQYFEPDQQFDSDVIGSYLVPVKYSDMLLADKASMHWGLDERVFQGGNYYAIDRAGQLWSGGAQNLQLTGSSATDPAWYTTLQTGIHVSNQITGEPFGAIRFAGRGEQAIRNGLTFYDSMGTVIPANSYAAFSMELWYKPGGNSTDNDGIIGWPNANHGVAFYQSEGTELHALIQRPTGNVQLIFQTDMIINAWYHLALSVTATGDATLYVNGVPQATQNIGTGVRIPPAGAFFCIGSNDYGGNFDDIPAFWADDVALYGYALTAEQVSNHYLTGVNGPYRRHRLTGGDPDTQGASYSLNANEYSLLVNEEDITAFVADYTCDYDLKQIVSTGSLRVYESWGLLAIGTKLRANTYVIIDRRYISQSLSVDSDWQPLGHFLVEGPMGSSIQAGKRVYDITLRGIAKLFGLDYANVGVEADKLLMRRKVLDYRESTVEWTKFKLQHPAIADGFYENWAEFPSVRLWVTDFQNIGDGTVGGVENSTEILRIKGSEGAVKILGGEGAVVIDNDFLNSTISENGLGRPQTVMAEFWRYARPYDITQHSITSIEYDMDAERWNMTVNNNPGDLDGKTLFVRSGEAKGKIFKITEPWVITEGGDSTPSFLFVYDTGSAVVNVSRPEATITNWSIGTLRDKVCAQTFKAGSSATHYTTLLKTTMVFNGNVTSIPPTAKLVGVEITYEKINDSFNISLFRKVEVYDSGMYIKFDDDYQTNNFDQAGEWSKQVWSETKIGGIGQLFGLANDITWATAQNWVGTTEFYAGAKLVMGPSTTAGVGFKIFGIKLLFSDAGVESDSVVYLVDLNGYPINPVYEDLAVGDDVQIGDFNRVEDALQKVSIRNNFQEVDSSLPFYYTFEPCPAVLAPAVPPIRTTIFDSASWMDLLEQILDAAPPNYRLQVEPNGVLTAKLYGFVPGASPAHNLEGTLDITEDHSDYGVATRVIVRGQSDASTNLALSKSSGGSAACHAYVLSGYAASTAFSMGRTVTQNEANAIWRQVFNGNPKTPVPTLSNDWLRDGKYNYYGTILYAYNTLANVKRWTFEDTDLCAIDIGRSSRGNPIEIQAIEATWFNHYIEGGTLKQSMYVYYMTEDDYESVYGTPPPSSPDENDTTYFPPANSSQWKLLVDEFVLDDGQTTIEASDFANGRTQKVRFLKFKVGQAHYRFPIDRDPERDRAIASVNLAELRVYPSQTIVATSELGNVAPFDSAEHKALATRIRRRTDVLDINPTLDSYDKAKNYGNSELQERFVDFTPLALTALAPTVQVGEIVRLTHPETRVAKTYLVIAVSHQKNCVAKMQVINYEIKL